MIPKLIRVVAGLMLGYGIVVFLDYAFAYSFFKLAQITDLRILTEPLIRYGFMILIAGLIVGIGKKKGILRDWLDTLLGK
jgi:hypothetical protein